MFLCICLIYVVPGRRQSSSSSPRGRSLARALLALALTLLAVCVSCQMSSVSRLCPHSADRHTIFTACGGQKSPEACVTVKRAAECAAVGDMMQPTILCARIYDSVYSIWIQRLPAESECVYVERY